MGSVPRELTQTHTHTHTAAYHRCLKALVGAALLVPLLLLAPLEQLRVGAEAGGASHHSTPLPVCGERARGPGPEPEGRPDAGAAAAEPLGHTQINI